MKLDKNTKIGKSRFVPFAFYIFIFLHGLGSTTAKKTAKTTQKRRETQIQGENNLKILRYSDTFAYNLFFL